MHKVAKTKRAPKNPESIEFSQFQENMDSWVKGINTQIANMSAVTSVVKENSGNIQHNYEMVRQLVHEVERLRSELETVKLMQIVVMNQQRTEQKTDMR